MICANHDSVMKIKLDMFGKMSTSFLYQMLQKKFFFKKRELKIGLFASVSRKNRCKISIPEKEMKIAK